MLKLAFHLGKAGSIRLAALPREAAIALGGTVADQPPIPRRLWIANAVILPLAWMVWFALHHYVLVMSASVNAWVVQPAPGLIAKGDLVSFDLVHPLAGPVPVRVTKRVMCVGGEKLRQIALPMDARHRNARSAYLCDGRLVGVSRAFGRNGQALAPYPWGDHPIPPGQAYLGSDHDDGFDSRYYGLIAIERLTRMERVL